MNASSRLLVYFWLVGAAGAHAADPALPIKADAQESASAKPDVVYAAGFNPFASSRTAVNPPVVQASAQRGDLALPLAVALAGMICIGLLVRKFLD
jgi:hypothetical protein